MKTFRSLLLLFIVVIFSACGAHVSPKATETNSATVKSEVDLSFVRLNSKDLTVLGLWPAHELVLEPGFHKIRIKYKNENYVPYNANWKVIYTGYHNLGLKVENGHSYLAKAVQRGKKQFVWIVDQTSNKVVAGSMPPMR